MKVGTVFTAGAGTVEITPRDSQFLQGYPHVKRYSTGIHDPLYSSALYLSDGNSQFMIIANDIVSLSKEVVGEVRLRIAQATTIPKDNIMVAATHTHSGPLTLYRYVFKADTCIPDVDHSYIQYLIDGIVNAAISAYKNAKPARLGLGIANGTGLGSNRHDPAGPRDSNVPVLMVQTKDGKTNLSCMLVCSMHPTVLHENSTLISADFPGMARQWLQKDVIGPDCNVLYLMGPAGNQSPRHVVRENTFSEAKRLGKILSDSIAKILPEIEYVSDISLQCVKSLVSLSPKKRMNEDAALQELNKAKEKYNQLQKASNSGQEIRTAECDVFGAEQNLALAKAKKDGLLEEVYKSCLPAEIQIIKIGPWIFVGWPGEFFVEYALQVKEQVENAYIISNANGELQSYIVTPAAENLGRYEASIGLFGSECGKIFVNKTLQMLQA